MKNNDAILFSLCFDKNGGATELSGDDISQKIKSRELAWVHMNALSPETRAWLKNEASYLDDLILDALLEDETRPRIVEYDDGVLLILRGMNFNEGQNHEDMVSIRIWLDSHRIISIERRHLKTVDDIKNKLLQNKGPKDVGEFLTSLSSRLFERMEPVLTLLDEKSDEIEESVMESPSSTQRKSIVDVRKKAILFRRYIAPQRDVMQHLKTSELKWLTTPNKRHIQENYDRLFRYIEDLDAIRERAQVVKDELTNALSDRLNKNLYILSVISAIFLPLGFLTGLLGINIGGIPGTESPYAFWIFNIILIFVVSCQIFIFKKLKWF